MALRAGEQTIPGARISLADDSQAAPSTPHLQILSVFWAPLLCLFHVNRLLSGMTASSAPLPSEAHPLTLSPRQGINAAGKTLGIASVSGLIVGPLPPATTHQEQLPERDVNRIVVFLFLQPSLGFHRPSFIHAKKSLLRKPRKTTVASSSPTQRRQQF